MYQHQHQHQPLFQNDWVVINADWLHPHQGWMNDYTMLAGKTHAYAHTHAHSHAFSAPTMNGFLDDMNITMIGLYFVAMMMPIALVVSAILSQHAIDWFNTNVVPFILSKRPHRPTVTVPYQYQYNLEFRDYSPNEFRKLLSDGEEGASATSAPTSETETSYPPREYDHTYVSDMTPDGIVFMRFSPKHDAFVYYSSRTIIYSYLNALARKYVINTNNPAVFINPVRHYDTTENENKDNTKQERDELHASESDSDSEPDTATKPQVPSVFIRPKPVAGSMRAVGAGAGAGTGTGNDANSRKVATYVPANKFIHLGTIADMKLGQHQRIEKKTRPMTFADFKSMFFGRTDTGGSV